MNRSINRPASKSKFSTTLSMEPFDNCEVNVALTLLLSTPFTSILAHKTSCSTGGFPVKDTLYSIQSPCFTPTKTSAKTVAEKTLSRTSKDDRVKQRFLFMEKS